MKLFDLPEGIIEKQTDKGVHYYDVNGVNVYVSKSLTDVSACLLYLISANVKLNYPTLFFNNSGELCCNYGAIPGYDKEYIGEGYHVRYSDKQTIDFADDCVKSYAKKCYDQRHVYFNFILDAIDSDGSYYGKDNLNTSDFFEEINIYGD